MNSVKPIVLLVLVGTAVFILTSALYAVSEIEQVIITQFGRPVGAAVTTAGLKLKVPFIQEVNRIDKRILEWDGSPTDMPTEDKLYISVDLFARWRIKDPLQYFLRLRDERSAQSRLDDIIGSETRNAVAKHELIEIVRTTRDRKAVAEESPPRVGESVAQLIPIRRGRSIIEHEVYAAATHKLADFGIE